ncbi:MAG: type II secretion system GspH family protein [Fibromonadaceae bacterium]|nr:type II secretion system GspH family protein [Fibromonadaceae bacterium]
MSSKIHKKGFTLLELLVVMILIGILASLAYSSFMDIIQANKAKDAARTLTAFAERAIAEGKMRKEDVTITINQNEIKATFVSSNNTSSEPLPKGFSPKADNKPTDCGGTPNADIKATVSIGTSGISGQPCFVACNANSTYCGAAVKKKDKNNFSAQIRKRSDWGDL